MEEASALANKVGILAKRMLGTCYTLDVMYRKLSHNYPQLSAQQMIFLSGMRHTKFNFHVAQRKRFLSRNKWWHGYPALAWRMM